MADNATSLRKRHFSDNWPTWAALNHFLSTGLLRELVVVIVNEMSNGVLSLDQLFEEAATSGPDSMESWLIRPLEPSSPLAAYLQNRVRAFVWQSDAAIAIPPESSTPLVTISPSTLESMIKLGVADLSWSEQTLEQLHLNDQPSIASFLEGIRAALVSLNSSTVDAFLAGLNSTFESMEAPLDALLAKHFGDLCADADQWDKALALYNDADRRLSQAVIPAWSELVMSLHAIITQSRAAAERSLSSPGRAAALLIEALGLATMKENPLLLANASLDALATTYAAKDAFALVPDRRPTLLSPPLIHGTHNASAALQSWLNGEFNGSHRQFWALLRRQIALGSSTESRTTKALYARSILDDLDKTVKRRSQPEFFQLAIRLLLESGSTASASQIHWNEKLVDMYVDQRSVDLVISHAKRHRGSEVERRRVAVELFQKWVEAISQDHIGVAECMLKYIAEQAFESPSSFNEQWNLGGRSLEVLSHVARKRPELRRGTTSEVSAAVMEKLRTAEFWTARTAALDVALDFSDAFSSNELQAIIAVTLSMLDGINPSADVWPVVGPALRLLVSQPIKRLSTQMPDLGRRIVATVLRFGLHQESERTRVLFYLHNFDAALLRDAALANELQDTVTEIRRRSQLVKTSNVVESIQALLLAPIISGQDGVKDALDGLASVLRSAADARPSIALPVAYDPLLLLANQQQQIASDISMSLDSFRSWLDPILTLVVDLWLISKDRPLVFAMFSLPPATKPDSTIVHNWAFASILLAESLQQGQRLQVALAAAATEPVLADPIALARATRSAAGDLDSIEADAIRAENRETFYAALGRRLVVLQKIDAARGRDICKVLLDQCFRLGPRSVDAAVFLSAARLDLGGYITDTDHSNYLRRLENDRDLRLALTPLLDMFGAGR